MKNLLTLLVSVTLLPSLSVAMDVPPLKEPIVEDRPSSPEGHSRMTLEELTRRRDELKAGWSDALAAKTNKRLEVAHAKEAKRDPEVIQKLEQESKDLQAEMNRIKAEQKDVAKGIQDLQAAGEKKHEPKIDKDAEIVKVLKEKLEQSEGQICLLLLNNTVKSLDEGPVQNAAKSASGVFTKAFGQPAKLYGRSEEEKKKSKIKCGRFIHRIGSDFKLVHWEKVAEALAVPYKVFGQKLTIEEYKSLNENERFKHIREVEADQVHLIPRAMREADYQRLQNYNETAKEKLPFTIGAYGLAGGDIAPSREEEEVRKAIDAVNAQINRAAENSPEFGALILKKKNLERLLQSTGGKSGGREKGVQFQKGRMSDFEEKREEERRRVLK